MKVTHRLSDGTERSFYVECKYNYASANYFKFQVEVENGRFRYDPKFFEAGCSDEEKEEVRKLFAEIDLTGFFEELVQDDRVRSSWEFFQRQIKDIATFLKHDDKWKDFAEGLKQQYVFPRDLPAMANVFDLYVDEYESRYKGLLKKACEMISPAGVGDEAYEYYAKKLEHTADDDEVHDAVESLWAHYDSDEAYVRVGPDGEREWVDISVSDPEEFESLVEQCHVIEGALNQTLVMMGKPAHAFGELRRLQPAEKLRYFFQVCVSTAKNEKTKWERFLTVKDAPGVMSVVRVDDYESRRLAGMISRYYETHGRCQYVQVQDCVFRLAESNALGLEGLPVFSDQVQKFYVDVHVSDDLRKIGLKIFAKEPDFDGKKYSFVESDTNYVGKRHRPVFVKLG